MTMCQKEKLDEWWVIVKNVIEKKTIDKVDSKMEKVIFDRWFIILVSAEFTVPGTELENVVLWSTLRL